MAEDTDRDR